MKNFKFTGKTIGNIVKVGGGVILYGLATVASKTSIKDIIDMVRYSGDVDYSDAVNAIMGSDMFGSYKADAVELLKRDMSTTYYKAVITIVRSDMFGSYKVTAIKNLGEEEL